MSNDIFSKNGICVGQWDGAKVEDLRQELTRIKAALKTQETPDKIEPSGIPHQTQLPEDLHKFTAYLIWGCDTQQMCLVGSGANRLESVASIREFYANSIAKDALARHGEN